MWDGRRCPRGHHLDGQEEILDAAEADLYKCQMCDAEQTRMIQRTSQGEKGGSTNGLFIRWFPKGEKIVKRYLTWKGETDG